MQLQIQNYRFVTELLAAMACSSRILENKFFIQHGTTTVFTHCRNVALLSLKISEIFGIPVDRKSLARGALLHDYFLYDWHDKSKCPRLHGFKHPAIALKNAVEFFDLNDIEKDIIKNHMFPLTIRPPRTAEGFIVTISDKLCSLYETFKLNDRHQERRQKLIALR